MSCARFVPQKLTWRCGTGALRDILSPKAGLGEAPPQAAPQPSKNFRMWPYPNYFPISCLLKFLTPVSKIPIYDVRIRANQFHFCAISKQTDRRLFDDNRAALKQQISRSPQAAEGFLPQLRLSLIKKKASILAFLANNHLDRRPLQRKNLPNAVFQVTQVGKMKQPSIVAKTDKGWGFNSTWVI